MKGPARPGSLLSGVQVADELTHLTAEEALGSDTNLLFSSFSEVGAQIPPRIPYF